MSLERSSSLTEMAQESLGISHIPEGRGLFPQMTILENLKMGGYLRTSSELKRSIEEIYKHYLVLKERSNQKAGSLSGGEQQMLAIGRGLMANPKVLLLDEPTLGLSPVLVLETARLIKSINEERKISIVLVEQNARMALQLAQKGYVLETGSIVLEDDSAHLANNEYVKKAYLGG